MPIEFADDLLATGHLKCATVAVSAERRGVKDYFRALHAQIDGGGAEAMFYELRGRDLGDWHPRDIPEVLRTNPELQKQQRLNLPPLEQWYLTLLHCGRLPGALAKRPRTAPTKELRADARERFPRLKELSDEALAIFLTDPEALSPICEKYRSKFYNGWTFGPLAECRAGWVDRYGPVKWESDVEDWGGGV
jgi:hypothetical protein